MLTKILKRSLLALCVIVLAGCSGFQPRTANSIVAIPLFGERVSLAESDLRADFIDTLRSGLQDSGAQLVSSPAPGVIVLTITQLDEDKTVSAYSAVRQVREFNHYTDLHFTAHRQSGKNSKTPINPLKVRAERTQIYDSRYVLGVSEEEANIRSELRSEVVRLLTLKLSVL